MFEKKRCEHIDENGKYTVKIDDDGKTYCYQCGKPTGNGAPAWLRLLIWPLQILMAFTFLPEVLTHGSPADKKDARKFIGITLMAIGFSGFLGIQLLVFGVAWWIALPIAYLIPGVVLTAVGGRH